MFAEDITEGESHHSRSYQSWGGSCKARFHLLGARDGGFVVFCKKLSRAQLLGLVPREQLTDGKPRLGRDLKDGAARHPRAPGLWGNDRYSGRRAVWSAEQRLAETPADPQALRERAMRRPFNGAGGLGCPWPTGRTP